MTRDTASHNGRVKAPRPGPISKTVSWGHKAATERIFLTMLGSIRKCWPKRFFGLGGVGTVIFPFGQGQEKSYVSGGVSS